MSNLHFIASAVLVLTAVVHSVLGEILIFRHLRDGHVVPSRSAPPLSSRHVRILWATWHVVSVFGLAFALLIYRIGVGQALATAATSRLIAAACLLSSLLVLIGTRGRHPGWIALGLSSALIWLGAGTA